MIKQTPPRSEFSILINRDLRVIYLHEYSKGTALIEQMLVVRWATGYFWAVFKRYFSLFSFLLFLNSLKTQVPTIFFQAEMRISSTGKNIFLNWGYSLQ